MTMPPWKGFHRLFEAYHIVAFSSGLPQSLQGHSAQWVGKRTCRILARQSIRRGPWPSAATAAAYSNPPPAPGLPSEPRPGPPATPAPGPEPARDAPASQGPPRPAPAPLRPPGASALSARRDGRGPAGPAPRAPAASARPAARRSGSSPPGPGRRTPNTRCHIRDSARSWPHLQRRKTSLLFILSPSSASRFLIFGGIPVYPDPSEWGRVFGAQDLHQAPAHRQAREDPDVLPLDLQEHRRLSPAGAGRVPSGLHLGLP